MEGGGVRLRCQQSVKNKVGVTLLFSEELRLVLFAVQQ
jgi:hypothetical protein